MRSGAIIVAIAALMAFGAGGRAASMTIEYAGHLFSEKSIALNLGDTLMFQNHDDVTRNINVVNNDDEATDLDSAETRHEPGP